MAAAQGGDVVERVARVVERIERGDPDFSRVKLAGVALGANDAAALSRAVRGPCSITLVDLGASGIGDVGAGHLAAALEYNVSIVDLQLYRCGIGGEGAASLARALHANATLAKLNLGGNRVALRGAEALGRALRRNRGLISLVLSHNALDAFEVELLVEGLAVNSTLTALELEGNDVTPAAKRAMATELARNALPEQSQAKRMRVAAEAKGLPPTPLDAFDPTPKSAHTRVLAEWREVDASIEALEALLEQQGRRVASLEAAGDLRATTLREGLRREEDSWRALCEQRLLLRDDASRGAYGLAQVALVDAANAARQLMQGFDAALRNSRGRVAPLVCRELRGIGRSLGAALLLLEALLSELPRYGEVEQVRVVKRVGLYFASVEQFAAESAAEAAARQLCLAQLPALRELHDASVQLHQQLDASTLHEVAVRVAAEAVEDDSASAEGKLPPGALSAALTESEPSVKRLVAQQLEAVLRFIAAPHTPPFSSEERDVPRLVAAALGVANFVHVSPIPARRLRDPAPAPAPLSLSSPQPAPPPPPPPPPQPALPPTERDSNRKESEEEVDGDDAEPAKLRGGKRRERRAAAAAASAPTKRSGRGRRGRCAVM